MESPNIFRILSDFRIPGGIRIEKCNLLLKKNKKASQNVYFNEPNARSKVTLKLDIEVCIILTLPHTCSYLILHS